MHNYQHIRIVDIQRMRGSPHSSTLEKGEVLFGLPGLAGLSWQVALKRIADAFESLACVSSLILVCNSEIQIKSTGKLCEVYFSQAMLSAALCYVISGVYHKLKILMVQT